MPRPTVPQTSTKEITHKLSAGSGVTKPDTSKRSRDTKQKIFEQARQEPQSSSVASASAYLGITSKSAGRKGSQARIGYLNSNPDKQHSYKAPSGPTQDTATDATDTATISPLTL